MKPEVKKLAKKVLNTTEYKSLETILSEYDSKRDSAVKKFMSLDSKVGSNMPKSNRYKSRYAGIIKPVVSYCIPEAKEIRFPGYFVQNASNHLISCCRIAYRNTRNPSRVGVPFTELIEKMKEEFTKDTVKYLTTFSTDIYGESFDVPNAIAIYFISRKLGKDVLKQVKFNFKDLETI